MRVVKDSSGGKKEERGTKEKMLKRNKRKKTRGGALMIPSVKIYRVAVMAPSSFAGEIILTAAGVPRLIYNVLGKMTEQKKHGAER